MRHVRYTPPSLNIILRQDLVNRVTGRYVGVWLYGLHHGLRMARRPLVIMGGRVPRGTSRRMRELSMALSLLGSMYLSP